VKLVAAAEADAERTVHAVPLLERSTWSRFSFATLLASDTAKVAELAVLEPGLRALQYNLESIEAG